MATGEIKKGLAVIVPITDTQPALANWHMNGQAVYDPNTNTVRIYMTATTSGAITTTTAIGNVPAPYRPKTMKTVSCMIRMNNNALLTAYEGNIGTDGYIYEIATNAAMSVLVTGEYSLD